MRLKEKLKLLWEVVFGDIWEPIVAFIVFFICTIIIMVIYMWLGLI